MKEYQLIVIGAGPGGYVAALHAAKLAMKVAVVESREAGGTCLNRGCIPTKTLLHSSKAYCAATSGAGNGVHIEGARVDMNEMFAYKRQIAEKLSSGIEGLFKAAKVELIKGHAKIIAPGRVNVELNDGGSDELAAEKIIVATGSIPARPPIPGLELPGVMTSDELLEGSDHLYESIVIIGGGVIGIEFATFYSDLGCKVTVIEGMDRLLPNMDREIGQNLAMILKKQGVSIFVNSMVQCVEKSENGLTVCFSEKGKDNFAIGEAVLCAIGRKPYTDGLFAEGVSPEMDGRSIKVDDKYQTSIPGVYAIGDVSAKIQLAHVASAQGTACVDIINGTECSIDTGIVPSAVYCRPEIAAVGLTEVAAKEKGIPAKAGKCVMFSNARTLIADPGRCFMKVVANADTREVIGAQLMCEHSSDMISEISAAIANHLTVDDMLRVMRPHPSFEEALSEALEDLLVKLNK